mgnify:CR=1 FL=1
MGIFGSKKEKAKYIVLGKQKYAFELIEEEMKVNRVAEDIRVEEQTHNRFEMIYKNRKHKAEIIEKTQNKYVVEINGNRYAFSIETPISYQRKKMLEKKQGKGSGVLVTAPMPGKILDVMVSEGQDVKEGETLVILEAMKMQNEILASSSGKVNAIVVKPGDSVMKDDRLLELR